MNAAWSALANGVILSGVLAAAVWLILRFAPRRRWNAATRYVIWWIVLGVTLALPVAGLRPRAGTELRIGAMEFRGGGPAPVARTVLAARGADRLVSFPLRIPAGPWVRWLFAAWTLCSSVLLLRLILSYVALCRVDGEDVPGSGVRVVSSTRISIPVAVGGRRARILIPARLIEVLSQQDLDQVVRHEAAHLARRDDRWLLVQRTVEALFPLHPVVRWIARQIDLEREIACDDRVAEATNDARGYAACLTRMVELCGGVRGSLAAVNFAEGRSHLSRRVELLMKRTQDTRTKLFTAGLVSSAMVLAAAGWLLVKTPAVVALAAPQGRGTQATQPRGFLANGVTLISLLFDTATMSQDDLARAKVTASKLIQTRLTGDERAAILVFNGSRVSVRQDFTDDRDRLEQAIGQIADESTGGGSSVTDWVAALQKAVAMVSPIDGKKAIVCFSVGRPIQRSNAEVQNVIDAAVRAKVAFYMIDVR